MIYNYIIQGDRLRMAAPQKGNTGNINTYVCNFKFDGEWSGLSKFMAIKTDSQCIAPVLIPDNQCMIPQEALETPGVIYIGVYGTTGTAADYKRISTNWVGMRIDEGAYCEGTAPGEPAPDTWETYLAKVQALANRAEQAETGAIAAETEAAEAAQKAKDAAEEAQAAEGQAGEYVRLTGIEAAAAGESAQAAAADRRAVSDDKAEVLTAKEAVLTAKGQVDTAKQSVDASKAAVEAAKSEIGQQAAYIQSEVDRIEGLDVYTKPEADMRYLPKGTAAGYPVTVSDHLEGAELIDYRIQGNTGGVGDLAADGEHAGKYKVPVVCRGKNLFDIQDFAGQENAELDGNSITITGVTGKTNASCSAANLLSRLKPNTQYYLSAIRTLLDGTVKSTTFRVALSPRSGNPFYMAYGRNGVFTTPADLSQYVYLMIFCGADVKIKMSDIMIEEGSVQTAYEPYCAPSTADIYLDAPLMAGESVSCAADNLPALTVPQSGTITVSAETETEPSNIEIDYYQDINKKLKELQDAIIAGGTTNV